MEGGSANSRRQLLAFEFFQDTRGTTFSFRGFLLAYSRPGKLGTGKGRLPRPLRHFRLGRTTPAPFSQSPAGPHGLARAFSLSCVLTALCSCSQSEREVAAVAAVRAHGLERGGGEAMGEWESERGRARRREPHE